MTRQAFKKSREGRELDRALRMITNIAILGPDVRRLVGHQKIHDVLTSASQRIAVVIESLQVK